MTTPTSERTAAAYTPDFVTSDADLSFSRLWNADLAPTALERRTWSTYNIAALWIGMSVVITTYTLASGLMLQGMNWWQAMLTILLGNTIVLIPMVLNAHAGTKYGISFPVLCRASFGVLGANIPALLRAVVACGWFGIQTWIGALALNTLLTAVWPGWATFPGGIAIAFGVFWAIQVAIIAGGIERIKMLGSYAAPVLISGGTILLFWGVRHGGGFAHILEESQRLQGKNAGGVSFWKLFPPALTANVGYWATLSLNIPDFTRYAKSQRSQMTGQALGLPTTMTAFAFIGVAVTSATIVIFGEAIWDPVVLVTRIAGPAVIIMATLIVMTAQLHTNMAANVVSPSNDFSNLSPRRISFVTGGIITAIIGVLMMPWKLYSGASAYIFTWLIGYSSLMGALGGILIADYWVIRRQKLSVPDLFLEPEREKAYAGSEKADAGSGKADAGSGKADAGSGKREAGSGLYEYWNGINPRAVVALVVAVLPVLPGFLHAAVTPGGAVANPTFFDQLYQYAWFVTFGLSFAVYLLLMRNRR